jgi:tetratricopeptide (TPR) repeat protein
VDRSEIPSNIMDGVPSSGPSGEGGVSPAPDASSVPRRFGRFRLLREIGQGGMGVVYEAEDQRLLRSVALKTLFPLEESWSAQDRFLREARIAAALDHPNVVTVLDYGSVDGTSYYTMPLVVGLSLEAIIPFLHGHADGPAPEFLKLPEDTADRVHLILTWFEGALAGLEHAHRQGIVHRDLKPSNLILDAATGRLRITDFGLARAHHLTGLTQKGTLMGTVGYMSPEQVQAGPEDLDHRSDVYSMGVTLYRTLVDRLPYAAETMGSYLEQVVSAPLPLLRERSSLSTDLRTILVKSMEKSPARRYQTAGEFRDDLGRYRRHEPIAARPVGAPGRLVRWAQRRPGVAALGTLLLVAATVVAILGLAQWRSAKVLRAQDAERLLTRARLTATLTEDSTSRSSRTYAVESAREDFDRALELSPRSFEGRVYRALFLLRATDGPHDLEQGLEDLRVAEQVRPGLSSVHLVRSKLARKSGDTATSAREKQLAEATPPRIALDYRLRGESFHVDGNCQEAVPYYSEAAARDPRDFWSLLRRGLCYETAAELMEDGRKLSREQRLERARVDDLIVTHLVPEHAVPHNNLGKVLGKQQRFDRSIEEHRKAVELDPENAVLLYNLAVALRERRMADLEIGQSESQASPAPSIAGAGWLDDEEAIYRRVLEMDDSFVPAHNNLGVILADRGDYDQARGHFEAVLDSLEGLGIENAPGDPDFIYLLDASINICDYYLQIQDVKTAATRCEGVVRMAPEDPDAHYNVAMLRMLQGNEDAALDELERDIELGDDDYEYLEGDPTFEAIRDRPRFRALLDRMRAASGAGETR